MLSCLMVKKMIADFFYLIVVLFVSYAAIRMLRTESININLSTSK